MPLSKIITKPTKTNRQTGEKEVSWKGSPEMRLAADTECWDAFLEFIDDLDEYSAQDLMMFVSIWYLKVGYSNLGKMIIQAVQAIATERVRA